MAAVANNLKNLCVGKAKKQTQGKSIAKTTTKCFFNHNSYHYTLLLFAEGNGKG